RRRVANRGDGMPHVMLAIPKAPFAVLPCLPPVNRRQADHEAIGAKGFGQNSIRHATQQTTAFEAMVAANSPLNNSISRRSTCKNPRKKACSDRWTGVLQQAANIVVYAASQTRQFRYDQVALRRIQVAA